MDEATHIKKFKPINIKALFMNNPILYHHGYKKDVDFARATIEVFNVSLDVIGRANSVTTNTKLILSCQ